MQKKFLASLTAVVTAFTVVATTGITAFAIDSDPYPTPDPEPRTETLVANDAPEEVVENHDITISDGSSAVDANNSEVTVNGDINTSGTNGTTTDFNNDVHPIADAAVDANNSDVIINGNITAGKDGTEQTAIYAASDSTVVVVSQDPDSKAKVVGTDEGIAAHNSSVYVDGNVVGGKNGISADDSSVTVTGDVNTTGMQVNIYDRDGSGPIGVSYLSDGVYASGDSDVYVGGNVYGLSNGVEVNIGTASDPGKSTIYVGGTVEGGLNVHDNGQNPGFTKQNVLDLLPEITVYELKDNGSLTPVYGSFDSLNQQENFEVREKLLNSINYIIKSDSSIIFNDDLGADASRTANVGKSFTVKADIAADQYLDAGDNVSVTSNGNGTFTLTLTNNRGGINIRALLKPVPQEESSESSTPAYAVVVEEVSVPSTPSYADPAQAPSGAIVVASTPASAAAAPEIAAISGDKPARTVSYSMAEITPIQYKESIIQNVAAAPASGAFNIETDRMACFDTKMIEAFAKRPDIDVNVVFTYGGKKMKVVIPAGFDVRSLLDSNGYCGFLRLMSILGGTELK